MIPSRITTLSAAMTYRKQPDTSVPIQLVTWCRSELPFLTGPSSARTPREISNARANTIVECPSENQNPTLKRTLALLHQFAGRVVDRRDVVGVEGVAEPERVGGHADPDRERARRAQAVVVRRDQPDQHKEAEHVQTGDDEDHQDQRPPVSAVQRCPEPTQPEADPTGARAYCNRPVITST